MKINSITPCLWFNNEAEEAANFYIGIFPNSKILSMSRFGTEGQEFHKQEPGTAMSISFELNGTNYTALNGGPMFNFTEAVSFQVLCETQEEIDHFWRKLTEGGQESMCGWLKDKYGISWQIIPSILPDLMSNPMKAGKVMNAFMQMKKFDIEKLLTI